MQASHTRFKAQHFISTESLLTVNVTRKPILNKIFFSNSFNTLFVIFVRSSVSTESTWHKTFVVEGAASCYRCDGGGDWDDIDKFARL